MAPRLLWVVAWCLLLWPGRGRQAGGAEGKQKGGGKRGGGRRVGAAAGRAVAADPKADATKDDADGLVQSLRERGRLYLAQRDYSNAARCYAALLQVTEGQAGSKTGQLRRRCSLTLAECEIKLGNLNSAIARCSQVLDEMPSLSSLQNGGKEGEKEEEINTDEIRQAYGKAHYRRGVALDRCNLPQLALYELRAAHSNIPTDEAILSRIVAIESNMEERESLSNPTLGIAERSSHVLLNCSGNSSSSQVAEDAVLEERLRDVTEEAQASHPLPRFTSEQIQGILHNSIEATRSLPSPLDGLNPLAALAGQGGGGLGGLGGLGALGAFGQTMGNCKEGGNPVEALLKLAGSGSLPGMVTSVGGLLGLEAGTAKVAGEVVQAIADVVLMFKRLVDLAVEHRVMIVRCLLFLALLLRFTPLGSLL